MQKGQLVHELAFLAISPLLRGNLISMGMNLILASQSPRRRELLRLLGIPFQSIAADVDESSIDHPDPATNVIQTARLKASAISGALPHPRSKAEREIIIAADTAVTLDGRFLGKPADKDDAVQMLQDLRGRTHQVHTGMTLLDLASGQEISKVHSAVVTMRNYSDSEIANYVATGDPMDKAGSYAIQHPQFKPVIELEGCYLGVMGLSICHLILALGQLHIPTSAPLDRLLALHHQYHCPLYEQLNDSPRLRFDAGNNPTEAHG